MASSNFLVRLASLLDLHNSVPYGSSYVSSVYDWLTLIWLPWLLISYTENLWKSTNNLGKRFVTYLVRINCRAYKFSRICSARKLEIFARINFRAPLHFQILITCYMAIETKNRGSALRKFNSEIFSCAKLQKFGTNFRAISRKSRFCAKMREN